MKSIRKLREKNPIWLTVYWCDRCGRAVNQNEEPDHVHGEQCGNCDRFCPLDGDWGCCTSRSSVYGGRVMCVGDTCSVWQEEPVAEETVGIPREISRYRMRSQPTTLPERGSARTICELHEMQPASCGRWCERCGRVPDYAQDPEHFHPEQCGGCRKYRKLNKDWGYCASHESVYGGRKVFEHDTCKQWLKGTW